LPKEAEWWVVMLLALLFLGVTASLLTADENELEL